LAHLVHFKRVLLSCSKDWGGSIFPRCPHCFDYDYGNRLGVMIMRTRQVTRRTRCTIWRRLPRLAWLCSITTVPSLTCVTSTEFSALSGMHGWDVEWRHLPGGAKKRPQNLHAFFSAEWLKWIGTEAEK